MSELFDAFADDYDAALAEGLSASGESRDYFARGRLAWLAGQLQQRGMRPAAILDYGCGTGAAAPFWQEQFDPDRLVGVDVSARSVEIARQRFSALGVQFYLPGECAPEGRMDLAFCNGVFHHIPPPERAAALQYIFQSLTPGGLFALWENNPWNLGARYVMSRIPFDRDAVLLSPPQARRLVRGAGFQVLQTDFLFLFPRRLRALRGLEPPLARLPLGAQYQVLCRKPRRASTAC